MNTVSVSEPEGGRPQDTITTFHVLNNAGKPWGANLEHNGQIKAIPKEGLNIHINGGSVRIHGIDVTRKVQKGVENIFQHNSWNGSMEKVDTIAIKPTNSDNNHPPHHE